MAMTLTSPACRDGEPLPQKYSQEGENVSPPLEWSGLPEGTRELALICDDPDAPRPDPWVHWVIYKLSPQLGGLPEGVPPVDEPPTPKGSLQGPNTGGSVGYSGPHPPPGHGVHHYHFKLYALDQELEPRPGLAKDELLLAVEEHVLGEGLLVGTYERM